MRIRKQLGLFFTGTVAIASLGGCAGAGIGTPNSNLAQAGAANGAFSQSARASASGFVGQSIDRNVARSYSVLRPDMLQAIKAAGDLKHFRPPSACPPKGPVAFISDFNNSVVYELKTNPLALCAVLTGPPFSNPQGIATDRHGNLYVANTGASNILRYAIPYTGTPFVMKDPGEYPVDVAVDSTGRVAVTNIFTTSSTAGNVVLYTANSHVPTGSAQSPTFTSPRFAAFNPAGRLVFDDIDSFNSGVVNVGALMSPNFTSFSNSITTVTTANTIGFPGGVQVNTAHKVAIDDQTGVCIYTYPGALPALGTPTTTTLATAGDPVSFTFNVAANHTLEADASTLEALVNTYPAGTAGASVIFGGSSLPIGAGAFPTEQY